MDIKFFFLVLALSANVAAYVPYVRGIFKGETKPHAYTWLIWTATTSIGAAGVWYGGGGYPAISFAVAAVLSFLIFLLSLRFGTRDITRGDAIALIAALTAIFIWVGLENPVLSVLVGVSIDAVGYWPSVRKTYRAPWSESLYAWWLWIFAAAFSLLALSAYNVLTIAYYIPILVINILFVAMVLLRRRAVPRSAR